MPTITRVLLADMPRMTRDVLSAILEAEDDIEVVSASEAGRPVLALADESRADVVVVGAGGDAITLTCRRLLQERPQTRVVVLAGDDGESLLYELRPHEAPLGELSAEGLLKVIRAKRHRRAGLDE